jgi:RNA polymerase sigma factor (sigma-70 family)
MSERPASNRKMNAVVERANEDDILIKRFVDGDEAAFNRLATKYYNIIYWRARRITGNHMDADDVAQETLTAMYSYLPTFRFDSSFSTWLYRVVSTRAISAIRKRDVRRAASLDEDEASAKSASEDVAKSIDDKNRLARVDELLQTLPEKQREAFAMRHYEELTYEEMSELTGRTVGALKANYHHALQKLIAMTEDER